MALFVLPYFFRSFRLFLVFKAHNEHFLLKKQKGVFAFTRIKTLYCVRESNMIKWFVLILLPILAITIASLYVVNIMNFFPSFAIEECFEDDAEY